MYSQYRTCDKVAMMALTGLLEKAAAQLRQGIQP